jgi:hypothetical protein
MSAKNIVRQCVILVALTALSACSNQPPNAFVPNTTIMNNAANGKRNVVSKTAFSGQTVDIMFLSSVNADCSANTDVGAVRILQSPGHGEAKIVHKDTYPNLPSTNPRSVCNQNKYPSLAIEYTSNAQFTGTDFMTAEFVTKEGFDSGEVTTLITVK